MTVWRNVVFLVNPHGQRFQAPEYWASRNNPDNTEYALYLLKRTLKNKPKNSLEDYELEALHRLKKLLANKWENLCQQAEEQIAYVQSP